MAIDVVSVNNGNGLIDKNAPTTTHSDSVLEIRESATLTRRGIIGFTLSAGSGVISDISLFLTDTGTAWSSDTMGVHKVNQVMDTANATWNKYDASNNWTSPGGDFDASPLSTVTSGTSGQVQQFALNGYSGITWGSVIYLLVKWESDQAGTNDVAFASRTDGTPANRPYIQITYSTATLSNLGILRTG